MSRMMHMFRKYQYMLLIVFGVLLMFVFVIGDALTGLMGGPGQGGGQTDTVVLNRHTSPALRALRTATTDGYEFDGERHAMGELINANALYFAGDREASIALFGQVAGRIDELLPVADIIDDCARGCLQRLAELSSRYFGAH